MLNYSWKPIFENITRDNKDYLKIWRQAMDWVRTEVDSNTIKEEFIKWATGADPENIRHYRALPAWHFLTIGRIAYLINKDAYCSQDTIDWLLIKMDELLKIKIKNEDDIPKFEIEKLSVKEQKILEYVNAYSFIDAVRSKYIDDVNTLENKIYERFRKSEKSNLLLKKLYVHYKEILSESIDERTNAEVEKTIPSLVSIINILANLSGNTKIQQYKGDKKSQNAAKKVTFKTMDDTTNSISLNPQQIPGMNATVIYDTVNRRIMLYVADTTSGLGMKGTKITGFDTKNSFCKTLRNPKETLQHIKDASNLNRIKIVLEQHVNGKRFEVNGKINKNIIVLKTFK